MRVAIRMCRRFIAVLLALFACPATPGQAPPATAESVMPVMMEIVSYCDLSASDLDFGAYSSGSAAPVLGQSVIQLTCSPGQTGELLLDSGLGSRRTNDRKMVQEGGNDRLEYGLYIDAGRTQLWGDESGVNTRPVITTGSAQTINVYGQINAKQRVRDGIYSDTITVLLVF
jgi:spore coat protein U-like protein